MQIFRSFSFDAAHRLPKVPEGHKCSNLHGHTFKIELYLSGEVSDESGWILLN
jgi:6-pyruvoyltetrahydropterin/6-carboxytetrahydropterin synthase